MTTDEEYLDNLLKSLTENEQQIKTMEETLNEMTRSTANGEAFSMPSEKFSDSQDTDDNAQEGLDTFDSDLFGNEQIVPADEVSNEESAEDDIFADFFAEALSGEEENAQEDSELQSSTDSTEAFEQEKGALDENEEWQSGLDDLLAKADEQVSDDDISVSEDNMDMADFIDNIDNVDADLEEIDGLLKKEDSGAANDDMLAMLEGADALAGNIENSSDGVKEIETEDNASPETGEEGIEEEKEKPAKKKLFSRDKTKKKEKKEKSSKKQEEEENPDLGILDEKPSFLMKFLDFLTREENEGSESDEILDKINN